MLTPDDLVEMAPRVKAMMQTPGWKDYVNVISEKIALTQEAAIADDPEKLLYHRGSIDGLKAAVLSANDVLNEARQTTGEMSEIAKAAREAISARRERVRV